MMGGVDGTCSVLSVGVAAITSCCVSVGGVMGCSNGRLRSRWLDELLICCVSALKRVSEFAGDSNDGDECGEWVLSS